MASFAQAVLGVCAFAGLIVAAGLFALAVVACGEWIEARLRASWRRVCARWRPRRALPGQDGTQRIHIDKADVDRTIEAMERHLANGPADDQQETL